MRASFVKPCSWEQMMVDVDAMHDPRSAGFSGRSYALAITFSLGRNTFTGNPSLDSRTANLMPVASVSDGVLSAVRDLLPLVRTNAERAEIDRAVPRNVIERIARAGVFRLFQPKRYGGYEGKLETFFDAVAAIGGACTSTGWVTGVLGTHQWVLSNFSERAQDDVWRGDADALLTGSAAPGNVRATPVVGGYRVNGTWRFCSGSNHVTWHFGNGAIADAHDGPPKRALFLVPAGDVEFLDNWIVNGLRGTASCDGIAHDIFVPSHRVLPMDDILAGTTPGQSVNNAMLYRLPNATVVALGIAAPPIGATANALASFISYAQMKERTGGNQGGNRKLWESPTLQLRMATASAQMDALRALVLKDLEDVQAGARDETLSVSTRVRIRRDLAYAVHTCTLVMDAIYGCAGTDSMFTPNPLERAWRDVNAAAKHVGLDWDNLGTAAGRHLFGLEPRAQY
jgi:alkylation response protein AidB-like acyl-CoA dehydrogenase